MNTVLWVALGLIVGRALTQFWLARLNRRHVLSHAGSVPEEFKGMVTPEQYAKSIDYTLAKSRLHEIEIIWDLALLVLVLFTGLLPWSYQAFTSRLGVSLPALAGFLFVVATLMSLLSLPLDWYSQFRVEQQFGFNTTTLKLWWKDRLKGAILGVAIGYPLLLLLLSLAKRAGEAWWLWAWGCVLVWETLMLILAPVLILPLFNKFTPLPSGSLRDRLLALAAATGFRARSIQVMDGSKRSRHSNAFFTGFGRFRKIVLFDTLIDQLEEEELAAVLAHEIGHYKKGHIPKLLVLSALSLLAGFYILAWLAKAEWFYHSFGFAAGPTAIAFLLFALMAGTFTFWFTPLASLWSRRFEYQADAFAAAALGESKSLTGALRKLNEKNLSNLTPHPLYSGFYYSHPTLLERERALALQRLVAAN